MVSSTGTSIGSMRLCNHSFVCELNLCNQTFIIDARNLLSTFSFLICIINFARRLFPPPFSKQTFTLSTPREHLLGLNAVVLISLIIRAPSNARAHAILSPTRQLYSFNSRIKIWDTINVVLQILHLKLHSQTCEDPSEKLWFLLR